MNDEELMDCHRWSKCLTSESQKGKPTVPSWESVLMLGEDTFHSAGSRGGGPEQTLTSRTGAANTSRSRTARATELFPRRNQGLMI